MILHAGRSSNVAQDNDLHRPALLPPQSRFAMFCLHFKLLSIFVNVLDSLVLVWVILFWQRKQQNCKERGKNDCASQDSGEAIVELLVEKVLQAHGGELESKMCEASNQVGWCRRVRHGQGLVRVRRAKPG